jgi:hypothetical protein
MVVLVAVEEVVVVVRALVRVVTVAVARAVAGVVWRGQGQFSTIN